MTRPARAEAGDRPHLFESRDLRVKDGRRFGSAACFVTFTPWTDDPTLDREGFGERFLHDEGIDALHVVSRDNRWWQYPEMLPAMAEVRVAVASYTRVVTYGASMGAYAAVRLADEAGAHAALALSPQVSILPEAAPFEHRWSWVSRELLPVWEADLPQPCRAEVYIVHDPRDLDGEHADAFARAGLRFTSVRLRGAGHPVSGFLNETDLLKPLVRDVVSEQLDAAALEREAWRRRRRSLQHVFTLAERTHAPDRKLAVLRRALALAPDDARLHHHLGNASAGAGRLEEAVAAHRRALELAPDSPPVVQGCVRALAAAGRLAEARGVLQAAAARRTDAVYAATAAELDPVRTPARRRGRWRVRPRDPGVRPPADARAVEVAADEVGCVLCGPHLVLRPGRYAVAFGVTPVGPLRPFRDLRSAVTVEVTAPFDVRLVHRVVSTHALRRAGGGSTLDFVVTRRAAFEFRLFAHGAAALRVSRARPCRRIAAAGPPTETPAPTA